MSKQFFWNGDTTNLGRFSFVKKGDILTLTDSEAAMVERDQDKRFEPYDEAKHGKKREPAKPKDKETAGQRDERTRQETLAAANANQAVEIAELGSKTQAELIVLAEQANAKGANLTFNDNTGKQALISMLVQLAKNKGAAEEAKPQDGEAGGPPTA